jgi:hypothetical protein
MHKVVTSIWLKASQKLGFELVMPYKIRIAGSEKEVFAFVPGYGSPNGTLVELTYPPVYESDNDIKQWTETKQVFCSFVNAENFMVYDEPYFMSMLKDWGKFDLT